MFLKHRRAGREILPLTENGGHDKILSLRQFQKSKIAVTPVNMLVTAIFFVSFQTIVETVSSFV